MRPLRSVLLLFCAMLLGETIAAQDSALFDSEGYRTARYRSPIAIDPRPASHLALSAALQLDPLEDALFVDVTPVEGGVRDPASGTWRLAQVHPTIPGAQWHPEAGRGPVDPVLWAGLRLAVWEARKASPRVPVVVFCRVDCWMSWNAARRLAREGVRDVWWLAEGTDGWHDAGRKLVKAEPVKISADAASKRNHEGE